MEDNLRCIVIEIPPATGGDDPAAPMPRELCPWSDPYISQILHRRRLQAALADSLDYLASDWPGSHWPLAGERFSGLPRDFGLGY